MSVVFVHGVPDTQLVWDAVVSRLDRRDVLRVSLPGFGCSVPDGFSATKEAYVDWLIGELARLPGPIDVVGHDWGALLTVRAVSLRPTLVRSWAAGGRRSIANMCGTRRRRRGRRPERASRSWR